MNIKCTQLPPQGNMVWGTIMNVCQEQRVIQVARMIYPNYTKLMCITGKHAIIRSPESFDPFDISKSWINYTDNPLSHQNYILDYPLVSHQNFILKNPLLEVVRLIPYLKIFGNEVSLFKEPLMYRFGADETMMIKLLASIFRNISIYIKNLPLTTWTRNANDEKKEKDDPFIRHAADWDGAGATKCYVMNKKPITKNGILYWGREHKRKITFSQYIDINCLHPCPIVFDELQNVFMARKINPSRQLTLELWDKFHPEKLIQRAKEYHNPYPECTQYTMDYPNFFDDYDDDDSDEQFDDDSDGGSNNENKNDSDYDPAVETEDDDNFSL